MFRELESQILARSGRVLTAASGDEALEVARREEPSVAVLDLEMPGMSGDELCRRLKGELPQLAIIATTGGADPEQRARAVRAGASDVLTKPIDRISLVQAVDRFVRFADVRGLARVDLASPVRVELPRGELWGVGRNLSRGGMFIESACTAPESEVRIHFRLPALARPLTATAQVVWCRREGSELPQGMGVQFLSLDRSSTEQIDTFVYVHAATRSDPDQPGICRTVR